MQVAVCERDEVRQRGGEIELVVREVEGRPSLST